MNECMAIWVPFMPLACVLFIFRDLQFQAQRIYSNKHKHSLNWINLWIFDLISSPIFLCQGKLITFSIIRVSGESLQLLSRVLPQAVMLLSAFWSVCLFLVVGSLLVHYVSDHIFMHFYGKGMLSHAIKEVWRIFSICCSLIFLNPRGLMILFVIILQKIHTFFCLLKFLSK